MTQRAPTLLLSLLVALSTVALAGALGAQPGMKDDDDEPSKSVTVQAADPRGHDQADAKADPGAPVRVFVTRQAHAGKMLYRYQVDNRSPFPLERVRVGFDSFRAVNELAEAPSGWQGEGPPPSVGAPDGWTARVIHADDAPVLRIEWTPDSHDSAVPAGGLLAGFQVEVDAADALYEHSHFAAFTAADSVVAFSGLMEPEAGAALEKVARSPGIQVQTAPRKVSTTFPMPAAGYATVSILDASGRPVRRLLQGAAHAGENVASWDRLDASGAPVAPGTYFVRVTTPYIDRIEKLAVN